MVEDLLVVALEEVGIYRNGDEGEETERNDVEKEVERLDGTDVAYCYFVTERFRIFEINLLAHFVVDKIVTHKFASLGVEEQLVDYASRELTIAL